MNILDYTNNLILEADEKDKKSKTKKNSADKEKSETEEQFLARVKFNRMKRELLKSRMIKIGEPKKVWGPHETAVRDKILKGQSIEKQEQAKMAKQQHDLQVMKLTPKVTPPKPTSPNLVGAGKEGENINKKIALKPKGSISDIVPKGNDNKVKLNSIIKLSKGMEKSMGKGMYKCGSCGFPVPKYKGKYTKYCPGCSKELIRK